ncbi:MAG TPA: arginase family protein, partial [Candidatus Limnocylindria bacterium]|nr:arginase family protein [Candidatus Limnocylindria bacterium]
MTGETFLGLPSAELASVDADVVILGAPHGVAYPLPGMATDCADAPAAIRRRSARLARFAANHDFDLDGPMLPAGADGSPALRVVDCGDVPGSRGDGAANVAGIERAVRTLVERGAIPLVLGGDDSVPIPVLRGLAS